MEITRMEIEINLVEIQVNLVMLIVITRNYVDDFHVILHQQKILITSAIIYVINNYNNSSTQFMKIVHMCLLIMRVYSETRHRNDVQALRTRQNSYSLYVTKKSRVRSSRKKNNNSAHLQNNKVSDSYKNSRCEPLI